jgi:hypothetical protein
VLAMQWWEDASSEKEDVLLAVVETANNRLYLSCFPRKNLALGDQRLINIDASTSFPWGIALPTNFNPSSMSLLSDNQSRAVVMIADCGSETALVFQLQRSLDNFVKCSLALHGGMNPNIKDVFLASTSFDFDLEDSGTFYSLVTLYLLASLVC